MLTVLWPPRLGPADQASNPCSGQDEDGPQKCLRFGAASRDVRTCRGADIEVVDKQGQTPLTHVGLKVCDQIVMILLRVGGALPRVRSDGVGGLYRAQGGPGPMTEPYSHAIATSCPGIARCGFRPAIRAIPLSRAVRAYSPGNCSSAIRPSRMSTRAPWRFRLLAGCLASCRGQRRSGAPGAYRSFACATSPCGG